MAVTTAKARLGAALMVVALACLVPETAGLTSWSDYVLALGAPPPMIVLNGGTYNSCNSAMDISGDLVVQGNGSHFACDLTSASFQLSGASATLTLFDLSIDRMIVDGAPGSNTRIKVVASSLIDVRLETDADAAVEIVGCTIESSTPILGLSATVESFEIYGSSVVAVTTPPFIELSAADVVSFKGTRFELSYASTVESLIAVRSPSVAQLLEVVDVHVVGNGMDSAGTSGAVVGALAKDLLVSDVYIGGIDLLVTGSHVVEVGDLAGTGLADVSRLSFTSSAWSSNFAVIEGTEDGLDVVRDMHVARVDASSGFLNAWDGVAATAQVVATDITGPSIPGGKDTTTCIADASVGHNCPFCDYHFWSMAAGLTPDSSWSSPLDCSGLPAASAVAARFVSRPLTVVAPSGVAVELVLPIEANYTGGNVKVVDALSGTLIFSAPTWGDDQVTVAVGAMVDGLYAVEISDVTSALFIDGTSTAHRRTWELFLVSSAYTAPLEIRRGWPYDRQIGYYFEESTVWFRVSSIPAALDFVPVTIELVDDFAATSSLVLSRTGDLYYAPLGGALSPHRTAVLRLRIPVASTEVLFETVFTTTGTAPAAFSVVHTSVEDTAVDVSVNLGEVLVVFDSDMTGVTIELMDLLIPVVGTNVVLVTPSIYRLVLPTLSYSRFYSVRYSGNSAHGGAAMVTNKHVLSFTTEAAPTTLAPTTLAPTTLAPTTLAPTTLAPTMAPTTPAPAPTTLAPTTLAPTMAPTTPAPAPTTLAPTTPAPAPTTLAPTTLAPTMAPTTPAPAPTTAGPTTLAPPLTAGPTTPGPTTSVTSTPTPSAGIQFDMSVLPEVFDLRAGASAAMLLTVTGSGFSPGADPSAFFLRIGVRLVPTASALTVVSATEIHVLVPAGTLSAEDAGYLDVELVRPDGATGTATASLFATMHCPEPNTVGFDGACGECPTGAVCPGGNRVWPQDGYWTPHELTGYVIECNLPLSCNGSAGCSEGYTGYACGTCDVGYFLRDRVCVPCVDLEVWGAALVVVDIAVLGSLFLGFLFLPHGALATLVHALVMIQLLRGAGALLDAWQMPAILQGTYRVLSAAQVEGVSESGCVVGGGGFVDTYNGILIQISAFIVFALVVMPVVAFIVRTTCASARCCKCAGTFSRGRVSAAFVHFFAYASFYVTWQSVAVLNCAPSRAGGSRLVVDQTQECWAGLHLPAATAAILILSALVIYPLIVLYGLSGARRRAQDLADELEEAINTNAPTKEDFQVMVDRAEDEAHEAQAKVMAKYTAWLQLVKPKRYWWEAVWFYVRMLVGAILALEQFPEVRLFSVMAILVFYLVAMIAWRPYAARVTLVVTAAVLGVTVFSLLLGLAYSAAFGTVVFVAVVLAVLCAILGAVLMSSEKKKTRIERFDMRAAMAARARARANGPSGLMVARGFEFLDGEGIAPRNSSSGSDSPDDGGGVKLGYVPGETPERSLGSLESLINELPKADALGDGGTGTAGSGRPFAALKAAKMGMVTGSDETVASVSPHFSDKTRDSEDEEFESGSVDSSGDANLGRNPSGGHASGRRVAQRRRSQQRSRQDSRPSLLGNLSAIGSAASLETSLGSLDVRFADATLPKTSTKERLEMAASVLEATLGDESFGEVGPAGVSPNDSPRGLIPPLPGQILDDVETANSTAPASAHGRAAGTAPGSRRSSRRSSRRTSGRASLRASRRASQLALAPRSASAQGGGEAKSGRLRLSGIGGDDIDDKDTSLGADVADEQRLGEVADALAEATAGSSRVSSRVHTLDHMTADAGAPGRLSAAPSARSGRQQSGRQSGRRSASRTARRNHLGAPSGGPVSHSDTDLAAVGVTPASARASSRSLRTLARDRQRSSHRPSRRRPRPSPVAADDDFLGDTTADEILAELDGLV